MDTAAFCQDVRDIVETHLSDEVGAYDVKAAELVDRLSAGEDVESSHGRAAFSLTGPGEAAAVLAFVPLLTGLFKFAEAWLSYRKSTAESTSAKTVPVSRSDLTELLLTAGVRAETVAAEADRFLARLDERAEARK